MEDIPITRYAPQLFFQLSTHEFSGERLGPKYSPGIQNRALKHCFQRHNLPHTIMFYRLLILQVTPDINILYETYMYDSMHMFFYKFTQPGQMTLK